MAIISLEYANLTYMSIWHIIHLYAKNIEGNSLRIISKKMIRDFSQENSQAELPLLEWYLKMQIATPKNLTELRKIFNTADYAQALTGTAGRLCPSRATLPRPTGTCRFPMQYPA